MLTRNDIAREFMFQRWQRAGRPKLEPTPITAEALAYADAAMVRHKDSLHLPIGGPNGFSRLVAEDMNA